MSDETSGLCGVCAGDRGGTCVRGCLRRLRAVLATLPRFECGYYTHAVVEAMPAGLIPEAVREDWYRADYAPGSDDPVVRPCAKPAWLEQTVNFGMG